MNGVPMRWTMPLAVSAIVLAACSGSSQAAEWKTGKDVLDSLRDAGFACEWTGLGEQVQFRDALSGEESKLPTVRCDGYSIGVVESRRAFITQLGDVSECEPLTERDLASEVSSVPLVLGPNFVILPGGSEGAFPTVAQPEDFTKAFGGQVITLLDLYNLACPDTAVEQ
jgi:hypothetical protein